MQKVYDDQFCCFRPEKLFLDKSGQKNSKLSLNTEIWYQETNLNMLNSVMMFTFSVYDHKYLS